MKNSLVEQDISNSQEAQYYPANTASYCKYLNLDPPDITSLHDNPMFRALFTDSDVNCRNGINDNCCKALIEKLRDVSNSDTGACERGPMLYGKRKFSTLSIVSIITVTVTVLLIFIMIGHFGVLSKPSQ